MCDEIISISLIKKIDGIVRYIGVTSENKTIPRSIIKKTFHYAIDTYKIFKENEACQKDFVETFSENAFNQEMAELIRFAELTIITRKGHLPPEFPAEKCAYVITLVRERSFYLANDMTKMLATLLQLTDNIGPNMINILKNHVVKIAHNLTLIKWVDDIVVMDRNNILINFETERQEWINTKERFETEIHSLSKLNKTCGTKIMNLSKDNKSLFSSVESLKQNNVQLEAECDILVQERNESRRKMMDAYMEVDELKEELSKLRMEYKQLSTEKNEEIEQLQSELQQLQSEHEQSHVNKTDEIEYTDESAEYTGESVEYTDDPPSYNNTFEQASYFPHMYPMTVYPMYPIYYPNYPTLAPNAYVDTTSNVYYPE